MKSSAKKIELASVDDLFSTEEGRQDAKLEKIQEIPLSELHPFKNHPFKVKDDEAMMETADSIKQYGVLVPAIARPDPEGGYELVAGHRRHRASELAEKETMPVIVRDLDDDAATIIMVDSNLQRESLLPSERALVCTHPDGHNHSGNIHVHIVINSLRIYEVPLLPYMDRPADTREGCKHRCTNAAMEYFKSEVMEMCHREGLYQIDLLNGSKERITEREYWAAKKGQLALDKENAAREAAGQPTKPTKFETDKAKLRRTIRQALSQAGSFDEFSSLLLREGVTVKESRGRLSYLTPDRTKPITARKLGDDFDKAAVLALLTQNAHRAAEQTTAIPEYPHTQKERLREEKAAKTTPADNTLQRMVDREAKRAEGKGVGYDRWAAKHKS